MVFNTSLTLDSMKESIKWDDNFKTITKDCIEYFNCFTLGKEKITLPFKFEYKISNGWTYATHELIGNLLDYIQAFGSTYVRWPSHRLHNPFPANIISEAVSNSLTNGSGNIVTEVYHPINSAKAILRINNKEGKAWNYKFKIEKYESIRKRGEFVWEKGIGRGGFSAFYSIKEIIISYDNKGKDFLALIDLEALLKKKNFN